LTLRIIFFVHPITKTKSTTKQIKSQRKKEKKRERTSVSINSSTMRLMKLSMISSSFVLIAIAIGSIVQLVSTAVVAVEYDKSTCDPGPHNIPNPSIEGDIISVSPDLWYFQIPTTINDDDDNDGKNMIIIEVNRVRV
jgi:hypothetical protein